MFSGKTAKSPFVKVPSEMVPVEGWLSRSHNWEIERKGSQIKTRSGDYQSWTSYGLSSVEYQNKGQPTYIEALFQASSVSHIYINSMYVCTVHKVPALFSIFPAKYKETRGDSRPLHGIILPGSIRTTANILYM